MVVGVAEEQIGSDLSQTRVLPLRLEAEQTMVQPSPSYGIPSLRRHLNSQFQLSLTAAAVFVSAAYAGKKGRTLFTPSCYNEGPTTVLA